MARVTVRLVAGIAAVIVSVTAWLGPQLHAADQNRAGVVVRYSDGQVRKMCIPFEERTISGYELLQRTNLALDVERSAIGNAICKIGGTGCSSGDCFCRYPTFWGYWTRDAGERSWDFSDVGARDRKVRDGSLDGWSWGRDGKPAPELSFDEVCAARGDTKDGEPTASTVREPTSRPNYAPLAALAALMTAAAGAAYLVRRRRSAS